MNKLQRAYERGYRVTKEGHLLNPKGRKIGSIDSCGYYRNIVMLNGKQMVVKTHRLQALQKYGDKLYENGIVVRHLNGNSLDNSFNNIAIGTYRDNAMDIPKHIRQKRAALIVKSSIKYPKEFVLKLREEYKLVKNYRKLGKKYDMHSQIIWQLINKRKVFKDA